MQNTTKIAENLSHLKIELTLKVRIKASVLVKLKIFNDARKERCNKKACMSDRELKVLHRWDDKVIGSTKHQIYSHEKKRQRKPSWLKLELFVATFTGVWSREVIWRVNIIFIIRIFIRGDISLI